MSSKILIHLAALFLLGTIFAYHYATEIDGAMGIVLACVCGLCAAFTIRTTVAAAARRVIEMAGLER